MNPEQESMHDQVTRTHPMAFGRVMIAVDKSQTADRALSVGTEFVARLAPDVAVGLLHVVDLSKGFTPELGIYDDRVVSTLRVEAAELLQRCHQRLPAGVTVLRIIREGDPAAEIVAAADEWRADLIVLGAHARGPVGRFLLGSTAEAVVRRAHCPVLTVGHRPPFASEAGEPRAGQQSLQI